MHDNWGLDPYSGQIPIDEIVPHVTVGRGLSATVHRQLANSLVRLSPMQRQLRCTSC